MQKINIIFILLFIVILSGCGSKYTSINYDQSEKTTQTSVNEEQCYSSYSQVNITELEGLSDITEADIYIPIPNNAIWDAETKTYTMPDNYVNENGESLVMTISLEQLPEDVNYEDLAQAAKDEVEKLKKTNRKKYSGSHYVTEENVVVKYIKTVDKLSEKNKATETLKKVTKLNVVAYDFLEPTYYLEIELEIIKLQGTVDDTTDGYISAVSEALKKLKYHYQDN